MKSSTLLKSYQELIDEHIEKDFLDKNLPQKTVFEAARYALLGNKAKRIRPTLTLLCAEALGKEKTSALDPAIAIEYIHTYSLIHDDLPCMDDDDFRRGKPTVHKVYGEAMAVLAGDFLLTYAFEKIAGAKNLSNTQKQALTLYLSKRAGGRGLIAGQVIDMESEGKNIDKNTLQFMHLHKTACLFMASMEFGAIIANASKENLLLAQSFGKYLGLCFQIQDDLLDVLSDTNTLGKPSGSDQKNHKANYVSILGLENAKKQLQIYSLKAMDALNQLRGSTDSLKDLLQFLLQRTY